jgi:hypothetical protein
VPPTVHLYQIAYSPQTLAAIEPGYRVLDNMGNERPDWFEYWPIRRFLLNEPLDESAFYGFFSPKFRAKTHWAHADVVRFVQQHADKIDVALFSPQPDMGAFFLNVFEQAEAFDPGLIAAFETFLEQAGRAVPLRQLVMDSRQVVFSNYFVARPAFWHRWFELAERFFAVCEGEPTPLQQALTVPTSYDGVQRKVFVMERIAPLLLTIEPHWRTRAANPFPMGWSTARFREHPIEAYISDALKLAYRDQGFGEYLSAFATVRARFIASAPTPLVTTDPDALPTADAAGAAAPAPTPPSDRPEAEPTTPLP